MQYWVRVECRMFLPDPLSTLAPKAREKPKLCLPKTLLRPDPPRLCLVLYLK